MYHTHYVGIMKHLYFAYTILDFQFGSCEKKN